MTFRRVCEAIVGKPLENINQACSELTPGYKGIMNQEIHLIYDTCYAHKVTMTVRVT